MRYFLALIGGVLLLGVAVSQTQASHLGCHTGDALGFVAIRADPPYLVGTLPSRFTGMPVFFEARYNCEHKGVQARRIDLGTYEVRFLGLSPHVVLTDALSAEGVSSSSENMGNGTVRVFLRGPLGGNNVATRRDVPFSVVVY